MASEQEKQPEVLLPPGGRGDELVKPTLQAPIAIPTPPSNNPIMRNNQVTTVMLKDIPIVSLTIDGKERLCLAQISNTLLKKYSYNEIHNRRVALGITCVQCTPVQLEILRRAGAMPISSRRCGMITKREAERLVKSFLEDITPPKLPDHFAFDVFHECGWGGRGSFMPSRYNSSRAKCIKCSFCSMFFSPNKFIFHFHRTPESKYQHPDAANFNSWRRHLKLHNSSSDSNLLYMWEDVKAMFNGGNRKRVSSGPFSRVGQPEEVKRMKPREEVQSMGHPNPQNSPYPLFPIPNKSYPVKSVPTHPAFSVSYPYTSKSPVISEPMKGSPGGTWHQTDPFYPPYEVLWAKHLGIGNNENASYPRNDGETILKASSSNNHLSPKSSLEDCRTFKGDGEPHMSAFKPVGKSLMLAGFTDSTTNHHDQTLLASPRDSYVTATSCDVSITSRDSVIDESDIDDDEEIDIENGSAEENNNNDKFGMDAILNADFGRRIDVSTREVPKNDSLELSGLAANQCPLAQESGDNALSKDSLITNSKPEESQDETMVTTSRPAGDCDDSKKESEDKTDDIEKYDEISSSGQNGSSLCDEVKHIQKGDGGDVLQTEEISSLSKDELQQKLVREIETRRKMEDECHLIRENFQEQIKRELAYREEMTQQLALVRESLCHELNQEKKARYSLQQKLKEAHDALHNFSCKMLASRQCAECSFKEPLLPR